MILTKLGGYKRVDFPWRGNVSRKEITIANDRAMVIPEFCLMTREKGTNKYKYMPFIPAAVITTVTNTTNFICDIKNEYKQFFKVADTVVVLDVSDDTYATFIDEEAAGTYTGITIDAISAKDGGAGGTGYTLITCTGQVLDAGWTAAAGDILCLSEFSYLGGKELVLTDHAIICDGEGGEINAAAIYIADRIIASQVWNSKYVLRTELGAAGRKFFLDFNYYEA